MVSGELSICHAFPYPSLSKWISMNKWIYQNPRVLKLSFALKNKNFKSTVGRKLMYPLMVASPPNNPFLLPSLFFLTHHFFRMIISKSFLSSVLSWHTQHTDELAFIKPCSLIMLLLEKHALLLLEQKFTFSHQQAFHPGLYTSSLTPAVFLCEFPG